MFNLSSKPHSSPTRRRRATKRKAVATVELAICLPVLIALTLGTMDLCTVMFLKESATLAAYEGARRGVGRGRTNADAVTRVNEFLNDREIEFNGGSVCQIGSPGFGGAQTLENVTVTVTIPCAGNLLIPSALFNNVNVTSSVTMRKEYENLNNNNN